MAQKRKVTPKKSKLRKSSRKSSKKQIPLYKLLVYCALAISFLILLYLLSDIIAKSPETVTAVQNKTEISKTEKKSVGQKKSDAPAVKKPAEAKSAETKSSGTKQESAKPAATKPANSTVVSPSANKSLAQPQPQAQPKPQPQSQAQSQSQTQPSLPDFNFPQAQNTAKLVFVFDDGGQNLDHLEKFLALPFPITVAVLPQITKSVESAKKVRQSGNELMLHQPMQSVDLKINPGPGAILPSMSEEEIISQLFTNISQIGPVAGFNNHEGSAITADAEKMAVVLRFASEEGIYFLDSRTNVETKVPYVASQMGYGYYERNIFLDNIKTEQNALNELKKGLTIANSNGYVIMIGHIWSADFLPAFLQKVYPELVKKGYKFTTVSQCAIKY